MKGTRRRKAALAGMRLEARRFDFSEDAAEFRERLYDALETNAGGEDRVGMDAKPEAAPRGECPESF